MIYCKSNNNKDKSTLFTYSNRQYLHIHKFQNNKENRMDHFKLHSEYQPTGDQPQAIEKLVNHYSASYCSGNGISMVTFGSIVCNKLRQPQNYIEAVDSDSIEMKTAELLSGIDGTMMFRYNSRDTFKTLSIYLSEYQLGQRVSHKKVLELSYEDVKSSTNGLIVITPDFDNFTAKLIAADKYSKYMTEIPILEGVKNREYYGRSATTIENKCKIEYGTEQGLAALIYGEKGLSSLPIQDIAGEHIDTDNEYMYYYSVEFIK